MQIDPSYTSIYMERYEILEILGKGGGGTVYRAYDRNLCMEVVLKKIHQKARRIYNDRAEVNILKNLNFPSLPRIYDFFKDGEDVYTVMELIQGKSFQEFFAQGQRYEEEDILKWAKEICATLVYLHGQQPPIYHCDLKPANIMLRPDGSICVIDFNISASEDVGTAIKGFTRAFASPEQIWVAEYNAAQTKRKDWMSIDERSDLYSFGASIYFLLTGVVPQKDQKDIVPDIRIVNPKVSRSFARVIMKCLQGDPADRYPSAKDLQKALDQVRSEKKKKYIVASGLAAAAVLALVLGGSFLKPRVDDRFLTAFHQAVEKEEQGEYTAAIEQLEKVLTDNRIQISEENRAESYYVQGWCYEMGGDLPSAEEKYETAATEYEEVLDRKKTQRTGNLTLVKYYREYAVVLAEQADQGKPEKLRLAREVMDKARECSLGRNVDITFIDAQIQYREANMTANETEMIRAQDLFETCIDKINQNEKPTQEADQNLLKMRSYLGLADCMEQREIPWEDEVQALEEGVSGQDSLPVRYRKNLYIRMAGAVERGMGQDPEGKDPKKRHPYEQREIQVYEAMDADGLADYKALIKLATLYGNVGEGEDPAVTLEGLEKARQMLERLLSAYGPVFETYRDLAKTQALIQQTKKKQDPSYQEDYTQFCAYYRTAEELYAPLKQEGITDETMQEMEPLYHLKVLAPVA